MAVAEGVHPEGGWAAAGLGVVALEDKILQRAVVGVLNAIYEADFLGFSYRRAQGIAHCVGAPRAS
jgi:hypothetical protein